MKKNTEIGGVIFVVMACFHGCTTDDPQPERTRAAVPADTAERFTIVIDTTWADTLHLSYDQPDAAAFSANDPTPGCASTAASR